jgi:glycosyltransferase involved in cell wall biosynthesis
VLGIGITTHNRKAVLQETLEAVARHSTLPYRLSVLSDVSDDGTDDFLREFHPGGPCQAYLPRFSASPLGPAKAKNAGLADLAGCRFILLLDDDCRPRHDDWLDFFWHAHASTGIHHFSYLTDAHGEGTPHAFGDVVVRSRPKSGGVLMTVTPRMLEVVGGFNPRYRGYAHYFHASYSVRAHRAGLQAGLGPFLSLDGTERMLHALDYDVIADSLQASRLSSLNAKARRKHHAHNTGVFRRDSRGALYQPVTTVEPPGFWERLLAKPR